MYFIMMISYGLVLLLTPAAVVLSRWIGSRISLPILTAIAGYFPFLMEVQISFMRGFLILLFWTIVLTVTILPLSLRKPDQMTNLIWRSQEYTDSMFRWIESGELPEGRALRVVLFHSGQAVIYCVLAFLTANFLALVLGSALLNYMNFYVASLARRSTRPVRALIIGWNPWSIIRVLSFLYLGIAISTPTLWLLTPVPWKFSFTLFIPGFVGILLDLVFKITLSNSWRMRLQNNLAPK